MATVVIRNLDAKLHARLKARAASQGHSMEEEARLLLRQGLSGEPVASDQTLGRAMRALFGPIGGLELPPNLRERGGREPPDFSEPEFDGPEKS
ncbi:MAG: plasmid stabilization protein [Rhodospirillales bacterium]|nr:plasmid stabilization protein [Rhodospirillales bacterium]